jgi:two-component system phosphate regulon sensor histidine kinase PhoR
MCDPLLFKGVIMNLIDNSIKYSGGSPAIRLYTERDKHNAKVTVTDEGPGIPAEYHEKIFEKFFRVPSGNVHNVKGYGLGLNFASKVMALHKGSIGIKNKDKGCSFILNLPLS